jgi:hypothetical protein
MPTIDVDRVEFERLLGVNLQGDVAKFDEILAWVKSEVKLYNALTCGELRVWLERYTVSLTTRKD